MADREKVIDHLLIIRTWNEVGKAYAYDEMDKKEKTKTVEWIDDVLELLKEQEPVEPKYNARTNWYECGACHHSMTSGMHCRSELIPAYTVGFCAKCGRGVKWNE